MVSAQKDLSSLETTQAWVSQFDPEDQQTAVALLEEILLVSRQNFAKGLRQLVLSRAKDGDGPIGLYAERELHHRKGVPHRLFKETKRKPRRAFGLGPQPVAPTKRYDPSVGSEGLVAQLITELCREQPQTFLNHPGPTKIRRKKVRRFFLLTDFIGSGRRAANYIEAAWRVRSVKSWWSSRESKGFGFEVIAYSATTIGMDVVKKHLSQPQVHIVSACPTVRDLPSSLRYHVNNLCIRYDPVDHDLDESLGFDGVGALITFAHGIPNNAPRILHKKSAAWAPLFPSRVTADAAYAFADEQTPEAVAKRLLRLRQKKLGTGLWLKGADTRRKSLVLILAVLGRGPRLDYAISQRTGLTVPEIRRWLLHIGKQGWVDAKRRLTDAGHRELAKLKKKVVRKKPLQPKPPSGYYPAVLRAPSS